MHLFSFGLRWLVRGIAAWAICLGTLNFSAQAQVACSSVGGNGGGNLLNTLTFDFDTLVCGTQITDIGTYTDPDSAFSDADLRLFLPHGGSVPASTFPAKVYFGEFVPSGQQTTTYNTIDALTCLGADIVGVGVAAPATIALDDGESCILTVLSTYEGDSVSFSGGTLRRTGETYFFEGPGTVRGSFAGGLPVSADEPDIQIERPTGTAIINGGSDDLGTLGVGVSRQLTYTVRNLGSGDLDFQNVFTDAIDNVSVTALSTRNSTIAPAGTFLFTVTFRVLNAGDDFGFRVTFLSDDPDDDRYRVLVSGQAAPRDNVSPDITVTDLAIEGGRTVDLGDQVATLSTDVTDWIWTEVTSADPNFAVPTGPGGLTVTDLSSADKFASIDLPMVTADESFYFQIVATDRDLNQTTEILTVTALPHTTAPALSLATGVFSERDADDQFPFHSNRAEFVRFELTSNEAGTIAIGGACFLDEAFTDQAIAGTTNVQIDDGMGGFNTFTNEGAYSGCTVTVTDAAGNVSDPLALNTFTIDRTDPIVTLVTPIPALTNDSTPSFTFQTNEIGQIPHRDISYASGACRLASQTFAAGTVSVTLDLLGDDTYSDCVLAIYDRAFNFAELVLPEFEIDTSPEPEIALSSTRSGDLADGDTDTHTGGVAGTENTVTYTINNTGSAPLNVTGIAASAPNNIDGNVSISPTGLTIAGVGFETFDVTYTPLTAGAFSFAFAITSDDGDESPYDITVNGTATDAPDTTAPSGYYVEIVQDPINASNQDAVSWSIEDAEVGATYDYEFSSSGGAAVVSDTGTVAATTVAFSNFDLSSLVDGEITLTVTLTDPSNNQGAEQTDTATKDTTKPEIALSSSQIGNLADGDTDTHTGGVVGVETTVTYTINNTGGAPLNVTGIISGNAANIDGIATPSRTTLTVAIGGSETFDVTYTPAGEGDFNFDLLIINNDGDESPYFIIVSGTAASAPDITAPSGYSVLIDQDPIDSDNQDAVSFTLANAEIGATYTYEFSSSGGVAVVGETGLVNVAGQTVSNIDLSSLVDGEITLAVTLTDLASNQGAGQTDTVTKDTTAPLGYSVLIDQSEIDFNNQDAVSFTIYNAENHTDFQYEFTDFNGNPLASGGGIINAPIVITGSGPVVISDIDLSGAPDGEITLAVTLADLAGNQGAERTDIATKDTAAPTLAEVTPVTTPGNVATPDYVFSASKAGTITYLGACTSSATTATVGDNTITFSSLADGTYDTCSLSVTDATGNTSDPLSITPFLIDTAAPMVAEVTASSPNEDGSIPLNVVFTETVIGFDSVNDLQVENGTVSAPLEAEPQDGTTFEFLFTPDEGFSGEIEIALTDTAALDASGNMVAGALAFSVSVDLSAPTITITSDRTVLSASELATLTFTLSAVSTDFELSDVAVTGGTLSDFSGSDDVYFALFSPGLGQVSTNGVGTVSVPVGAFSDGAGNLNEASNVVQIDFSGAIIDRTSRIIVNFLSRRADQITANEPNLTSRLNRHVANANTAGRLTGQGDLSSQNHLGFDTSLRQIAAWQQRDVRSLTSDGDQPEVFGALPQVQTHGSFPIDAWVKATYAQIDNETASSSLGLIYAGADALIQPGLVLGFMGQLDLVDETDDRESFSASGQGWMAGPYLVAQLKDNLVIDARVAWGQSANDIRPFETYEDSFDSERWLLASKLTGATALGDFSLAPEFGLIYFEEKQLRYVDANGLTIPGQDISLGRLTLNPNLSRSIMREDGSSFTFNGTVKGIWDFYGTDLVSLDTGMKVNPDASLRARTEAGFAFNLMNGISLRADGFYDGIGVNDYDAYGGTVSVSIPLE